MAECAQAASSNLSVLDRQSHRLNWLHQQQQLGGNSGCNSDDFQGLMPLPASLQPFGNANGQNENSDSDRHAPDPIEILSNGWPDLSSDSSKKRKSNNPSKQKEGTSCTTENSSRKRLKKDMAGAGGGAARENEQPSKRKGEGSGDSSKDNNKPPKPEYIHVRARRGQATDSHSLAERVRREKISERMKYLQELVPGCDKMIGKAGMLDEIINYVQSLQKQVEFLSMKLAAMTPRLDISMDNLFSGEMNRACNSGGVPMIGMLSEQLDPSCFQFNSLQQATANYVDITMSSPDLAIQRTISAPTPVPDTTFDSCLHDQYLSAWDAGLHHLYATEFRQVRGSSFPCQSFHGNLLPNNLKMEM